MGIASPNYGWLTDAMLLDGARLDLGNLIHPRVEPEIAFRLGEPLRGPRVGTAEVLEATEAVMPALEVVDTRYVDYRFRLEDNTADNSSAAVVRLGEPQPVGNLNLRLLGVVLERDRHVVDTATGAAAMGDPAAAVAWLANALADSERALEPGDVVISGGLVRAEPIARGETVAAHFDRLGSVELLAGRRPVSEVVA
jgi:2-keto-4-pentenoate hydratase